MKKIFILCFVCAFLYCINAQNRVQNRPPQRVQRRQPPARVLKRVQPAQYTRAQQQTIRIRTINKQRGIKPKINEGQKRIKPAIVRGYWDTDWCADDPNAIFVHEDCDKYWYCDNGELYEGWCPDDAPIFDFTEFQCGTEDWAECFAWIEDNWDAECPEDPNELGFVQGEGCEDYFICINGWPVQWWCAPGQHWNANEWHCDIPSLAGCDVYKKKQETAKKEYLKALSAYRAGNLQPTEGGEIISQNQAPVAVTVTTQSIQNFTPQVQTMTAPTFPQQNFVSQPIINQAVIQQQSGQQQQASINQFENNQQMQQQQQQAYQQPQQQQPLQSITNNNNQMPPVATQPAHQNYEKCIRNGCLNPAIVSVDWEDEYCSNECVIQHCREVFGNFIQTNATNQQMNFPVK